MSATTIAQALHAAAARLAGQEAPRREAEILLCHVLGRPRSHLLAWPEQPLTDHHLARFEALVARRALGEPVAYLTGNRGFWNLELAVTPATLIPRPETERLVESALELIPPDAPWQIADLGTGSGAIALAVAGERPRCRVVATDASPAALAVAAANARAAGIGNVEFRVGSWFQPLGGERFHLLLSNPPYIPEGDEHLRRGDLRFEPASALASGADGLDDLRLITAGARAHLHPGGWLLTEHGYDQGEAVAALFRAAGLCEVEGLKDHAGHDRLTRGKSPSPLG